MILQRRPKLLRLRATTFRAPSARSNICTYQANNLDGLLSPVEAEQKVVKAATQSMRKDISRMQDWRTKESSLMRNQIYKLIVEVDARMHHNTKQALATSSTSGATSSGIQIPPPSPHAPVPLAVALPRRRQPASSPTDPTALISSVRRQARFLEGPHREVT